MLGRFISLHVISEDLFFDVVFHTWTCCGDCGGFSYTRMPIDVVSGCTDAYALNHDPDAMANDGSCEYSQEPVTFTKQNYADPGLAENQDRITNSVWITRGEENPLYNAALEQGYQDEEISPERTLWAAGLTAFQVSTDQYQAFTRATGGNHENLPGRIITAYRWHRIVL